jgi:hypothetical protein
LSDSSTHGRRSHGSHRDWRGLEIGGASREADSEPPTRLRLAVVVDRHTRLCCRLRSKVNRCFGIRCWPKRPNWLNTPTILDADVHRNADLTGNVPPNLVSRHETELFLGLFSRSLEELDVNEALNNGRPKRDDEDDLRLIEVLELVDDGWNLLVNLKIEGIVGLHR